MSLYKPYTLNPNSVLLMQALRDVVGKCLDKNPEARPTAAELLKHKFFKVAEICCCIKYHVRRETSMRHCIASHY